jgi:hypothetical protein
MRSKVFLVAMLTSLPIGLVSVSALIREARDLLDPCLHWGESSDSGSLMSLPPPGAQPGSPCATRVSGTAETRQGSILRTFGVSGGILLAVALGIIGAARSRYNLVFLTGWSMFLAIPILFSVWPLAFLAGAGFLWVANRLQPDVAAA